MIPMVPNYGEVERHDFRYNGRFRLTACTKCGIIQRKGAQLFCRGFARVMPRKMQKIK